MLPTWVRSILAQEPPEKVGHPRSRLYTLTRARHARDSTHEFACFSSLAEFRETREPARASLWTDNPLSYREGLSFHRTALHSRTSLWELVRSWRLSLHPGSLIRSRVFLERLDFRQGFGYNQCKVSSPLRGVLGRTRNPSFRYGSLSPRQRELPTSTRDRVVGARELVYALEISTWVRIPSSRLWSRNRNSIAMQR